MKLTAKHLELYEKVSKRGEGRGSSDLWPEEEKLLTPDQWKEFSKAFHDHNGDPEEFLERTNYVLPDFCVLSYLRFLILNEVKATLPYVPKKTYLVTIPVNSIVTVHVSAEDEEQAKQIAKENIEKGVVAKYIIDPSLNVLVKDISKYPILGSTKVFSA